MLHTETIERKTFKLLEDLMNDQNLDGFSLAGGTALSLYLGHRKSIDLDLFRIDDFSASMLSDYLMEKYDFVNEFQEKNTLKGFINDVKIDCITHKYENLKFIKSINYIRLYSLEDIAAMKLNAIADNGTRLKDFVDIACLSTKLSLNEMLEAYQKKYRNSNAIRALRALTYYADIIHEPINLVNGKYKWSNISKRIDEMIKKDMETFSSMPY
ncbi:MAG TPA: nucleotidyl transferase AbiEii/AbiGii toxin family protein [Petrimonas sp.]|uniref:nucleotidyl transferase AbiEii/AbiGii toxin family protein n=1 Tax=Petrimonas sp. TaxID=2023866 RepID=UPI00177639A3|nr:nucleotidyl transferase AbiEii/AbiGii toxin family protein [Petrimonas sp.]MEA5044972.1 nucleotidyl transferase AbiEii/AbiGii toxin family protein [Petrimonas sp.]HHV84361.1 nucleotidyl transferase AbiEii/AbiGii toxin family protein [Petrimonas sp.]